MAEKLERFCELLGEISDLDSASSVLGWDQQTYMPPGGAPARAQQLATLGKLSHQMFVSDEFGAALELNTSDFDVAKPSRKPLMVAGIVAPWVAVWESPQTTVIPGRIAPCSAPITCTTP